MRRDLWDVYHGTRPELAAMRAVEDEANKRLQVQARRGVELETFGSGEPAYPEIGKEAAIDYALRVFRDDVERWANEETEGFLSWIVAPCTGCSVAVFQVLAPGSDCASHEWAVEVYLEADRDGVRVDGGLLGRVDAAALGEGVAA